MSQWSISCCSAAVNPSSVRLSVCLSGCLPVRLVASLSIRLSIVQSSHVSSYVGSSSRAPLPSHCYIFPATASRINLDRTHTARVKGRNVKHSRSDCRHREQNIHCTPPNVTKRNGRKEIQRDFFRHCIVFLCVF